MKRLFVFLIIFLSVFFFHTADLRCATYEASYVPWSGYWWPSSYGGLVTGLGYKGHPSPLEKYDYVTSGTYYGPARSYGQEHYYSEDALSWYGMCFCWAAASILEEEPVHKGIYKGTVFRVGDKKGLLTVVYDGTLYNRYHFGGSDGPLRFHEVLEDFIHNQKTPIIMDLGSSDEVWNYPVFKYDITYTQDGNTRHYTTRIYYVTDEVHPDHVGARICATTHYYYFVLDGNGNITDSGWENASINSHPKNASEPFGTNCRNTGIDVDEVRKIATTNDDPYEENDNYESAALVSSGRYSLLAIDRDFFKVALKNGDTLNIRMTAEEDGDISTNIYDPEFCLIREIHGSGESVIEVNKTGNYTLDVAPLKQSKEPFYELSLQQRLSYQGIFPVDPSGTWYNGIALLSPDDNTGRTIISQMDRNGSPQMGESYNTASPTRHLLGTLGESFGLSHPDKGYLRVDSDVPLRGLQAATSGDYLMLGANLMPVDKAASELFFPHFVRTGGWQTSFGLINVGDQTEEILWQSYDQEGQSIASDTIELAPGEKVEYDTSYITAIFTSDTKSMGATATSGRNYLMGYTRFLNSAFASRGRALVPLDMEMDTELVAPHIALDTNWGTDIAVMNTGNGSTTVTFSAYDAEGNLIGSSEHILKPKQNFVSVVSSIFPGVQAGEIASMKIVSQNGQPLCGLLLYESTDELLLAGLPIRPVTASTVYLSHLACSGSWWTGIGVINAGDTPTDITFSLFNDDGGFLSSRTRNLNPNQRLAITIKNLFDDDVPPTARYMKIESSGGQPVSGIYLIRSTNGFFRMMGDVIH